MRKSTILLSSYCLLSGVAFAGAFDPLPMPTQTVSGRQVIINVPQTRLFVLENGKLTHVFPIAVGKSLTKTPLGEYKVTDIRRNPTWFVPASIQAEMRQSGKNVETAVPPGPGNPLGPVFIRFGDPALGLGMHGTNVPSSVPGFRSHGCVRLRSPDALKLAALMEKGVPVTVTYQPVLLNNDENGNLWVTAFADHYKQAAAPAKLSAQVKDLASRWSSETGRTLDEKRLLTAVQAREGKPVCVTCEQSAPARNPQHPVSPKPDTAPAETAPAESTPSAAPVEQAQPAAPADGGAAARSGNAQTRAGVLPVRNGG